MERKSDSILRLWILFLIATALLVAGWIMKSFPVFIFVGIAPLFAIADRAHHDENFWGSSELILLALTGSLFAARLFDLRFLVGSISQAIALTIAFVASSYVHQNLNLRLGKLTTIIFWLGIEYVFLKSPFRESILFLGDAVQLKPEWLRWNHYTGYLGASGWILICNFLLYLALIKKDQKLHGVFLVLALISISGPIILSYWTGGTALKREEMISVYQNKPVTADSTYYYRGEVIPRMAAVVSVLILFLTLIHHKTQKSK